MPLKCFFGLIIVMNDMVGFFSLSTVLYCSFSRQNKWSQLYGLVMLPVAISFIVYAMVQYMRRAGMIRRRYVCALYVKYKYVLLRCAPMGRKQWELLLCPAAALNVMGVTMD